MTFEDVKRLSYIRFQLKQLRPESRNIITDDMQWLADKLLIEWKDKQVDPPVLLSHN